jgi:hypothetical protein
MKHETQTIAVALGPADGLLLRSLQQLKWKIMGVVPTGRGGLILRRLMIVFAVAAAAATFALSAIADKPRRTEYTVTFSNVLTDVCSFPVTVDVTASGFEIDHLDKSGALRIFLHQVDQDTFTANGKMLVGLPYTLNGEILVDSSGNVTNFFVNGIYEKILLPDGSLFISAGRTDFAQHPGVSFLLSPDKGNSGNVAAFCAALSP